MLAAEQANQEIEANVSIARSVDTCNYLSTHWLCVLQFGIQPLLVSLLQHLQAGIAPGQLQLNTPYIQPCVAI